MTAIARAGGLVGRSELAQHWGVSRQRVAQLTAAAGFPQPVGLVNGQPAWLLGECDEWREHRPGPGRPKRA